MDVMTEIIEAPVPRPPRVAAKWNWLGLPLVFFALIALDRLTSLTPIHIDPITPWNPLLGVCLAIAMTRAREGVFLAFATATVAGFIVPNGPMPITLAVLEGIVAASQTAASIYFARRLNRLSSHYLIKNRMVSVLLVTPVIAAVATVLFVLTLYGFDIIALKEAGLHAVRFWVGNVIGVVIFTPLLARHFVPGQKQKFTISLVLEAFAQGAFVVAAVWVAFGEHPQTASRYLFILFLPMIWIVLRFGVVGAIAMNGLVQVSAIASLFLAAHQEVNVTLFQALLLVLSAAGITFGLAVDQSKAATLQLRAREEELSASLRMAATGELAGTLAHELGHPIGAISNYASALNHVLRKIAPNNQEAIAIGAKLTQEVIRATDTLHRLREFFRTGSLVVENIDIGSIVKEAVLLLKDRLGHNAISPYLVIQGGPNEVLGDRVQLRAVIYNLLVNAIDALKPVLEDFRQLSVTVRRSTGFVTLEIEDSGAGVASDVRDDIFEPLVTTKKDGLGLGLSMSRSVIIAHGGTITLEDSHLGGARFVVTLPVDYTEG